MKRFFVITVRLTDAVLEALSPAEAGFGYEWASILGRRASRLPQAILFHAFSVITLTYGEH